MKKTRMKSPSLAPPARDRKAKVVFAGIGVGLVILGIVWGLTKVEKEQISNPRADQPVEIVAQTSPRAIEKVDGEGEIAESAPFDVSRLLTGPRDSAGGNSDGAMPVPVREESSIFWDGLPKSKTENAAFPHMTSNIRKEDYAGAESCKECHAENYDDWQAHSHRVMNALANDETVVGDFSGDSEMDYLGGNVQFFMKNDNRYMRLERDGLERVYRITRTIGSRFTQYYVGKLEKGPEPEKHPVRSVDHVLPIGWWIDRETWVPVVHVDTEGPDGSRWDAFADASDIPYDGSCAACHTTSAFGDWLLDPTGIKRIGYFSHVPVAFDAREYLNTEHPGMVPTTEEKLLLSNEEKYGLVKHFRDTNAVNHAVNLGISCESCHNGSEEHVRTSDKNKSAVLPHFFPASEQFVVESDDPQHAFGRNKETINFICARCHSGGRPSFAGGMATWNSVEYSDAEAGYCYIRKMNSHEELDTLACTDCHDPHKAIGFEWKKTPDEDDASCLQCHQEYEEPKKRFRHTRHAGGTEGDRCLNCHMPRLNEGLQQVVRTHTIFNPTWPSMIEANHPNACNICHLDESIDWTIKWLSRWYDLDRYNSYDNGKLDENYPDRKGPVGLGWLRSDHEATRLVATDAFARQKAMWGVPELLKMLDDPYLLNRQFTMTALERMLGIDFEKLGYRYYMSPEERHVPLEKVRAAVLEQSKQE